MKKRKTRKARPTIYINDPETGELMTITQLGEKYLVSRSTLQVRHREGKTGWDLVKPTNQENCFKKEGSKKRQYKPPSRVRREALIFEFQNRMTFDTEWLTKPITVKST